jgi:hypothetical protein
MKTSKTRKFSPVQLAWMTARAMVDAKVEEYNAAKTARGLNDRRDMTDEECDAITLGQEALKDELGYYAAKEVLSKAEDALIEWSLAHALAFRPSAKKDLDLLRANAWKLSVRTQLIDAAARLVA